MEHQLDDSRGSVCDIFSRALPEFMAMGMTTEQFYEGHSWLAVSYKAADAIARRRSNFDSYLMSAYMYDTLLRLAPMFNPFDKRKVEEMMKEPFDLFGERSENDKGASKKTLKARDAFMRFAAQHNAALESMKAEGVQEAGNRQEQHETR